MIEVSLLDWRPAPRFDGVEALTIADHHRLSGQILRIYTLMYDGEWRTLSEIEELTGAPAASVSAQLRNLRKERFGAHTIQRRARGDRDFGLYEYRLASSETFGGIK